MSGPDTLSTPSASPTTADSTTSRLIVNPGPPRWPHPEYVTPDMEGPIPGTLLPCGCHLRRPDCQAILCEDHLAELNQDSPVVQPKEN